MGKFDGYLFVTDLDGTFLTREKTVSEENRRAVRYFEREGGAFTFITGRLPRGAAPILAQFTPACPIGCINGGGIYDPIKEEYLWKMALDPSYLTLVKEVDRALPNVGIELNAFSRIHFSKKNAVTEYHRIVEHFDDLTTPWDEVEEPMAKILFGLDPSDMEPLAALLQSHPLADRFSFIRSDERYYEILPAGSSKGHLLLQLARLLGIDRAHTIAIGDNDNDISMLREAQLGIAVSNASENTKNAADYITVSNEEHAIAKIIDLLDAGALSSAFPDGGPK